MLQGKFVPIDRAAYPQLLLLLALTALQLPLSAIAAYESIAIGSRSVRYYHTLKPAVPGSRGYMSDVHYLKVIAILFIIYAAIALAQAIWCVGSLAIVASALLGRVQHHRKMLIVIAVTAIALNILGLAFAASATAENNTFALSFSTFTDADYRVVVYATLVFVIGLADCMSAFIAMHALARTDGANSLSTTASK